MRQILKIKKGQILKKPVNQFGAYRLCRLWSYHCHGLASQKFLAIGFGYSCIVVGRLLRELSFTHLNVPPCIRLLHQQQLHSYRDYHALKVKEEKPFRVIAWAGDGGTFDIGLQSLSGALERNTPFTYICYDNEAYMNTGVQRSSATPQFASTTTTPEPQVKTQVKKDFMDIVAAHAIPYAASASIAYPADLQQKVEKAMKVNGASVLHIFSPCPTGQGFAEKNTVKIARLAVETGIFPL